MAKIKSIKLLAGLFSKRNRGQFVVRERGGQTIFSARPARSKKKPSAAQELVRARFKLASLYATRILQVPEYRDIYQSYATKGRSAHQAAMQNFLNPPVIECIDAEGYCGMPEGMIRIKVRDKYPVSRVVVKLQTSTGFLLEEGPCKMNYEPNAWTYTTRVTKPGNETLDLFVTACDLPGNVVEKKVRL